MRIEVWSDIACPWCWLGKRHLEEALRRTGVQAEVEFRSFQLDPSRRESAPAREYLAARYGSIERVEMAQVRLQAMGTRVGIHYDFERSLVANTFDAHRVHQLAKARGLGPAVVERMMQAYHAEGADLADHATIARLAVEAGADVGEVERTLAGHDHGDQVRADHARGQGFGVNGVPFFVFDERVAISGAQPIELFEQALRQLSSG